LHLKSFLTKKNFWKHHIAFFFKQQQQKGTKRNN
jgi:hypothetical protein